MSPPSGTAGPPPTTSGCGQYNTNFSGNARYCADGNYSLGMRGFRVDGTSLAWPVDSLGPPTAQTSDLPGRAMWGGLTETPKNCISTITVSWYVPHAVKKVHGQPSYTILVQKQGGYIPSIELGIDASAIKGLKNFTFKGDIQADRYFLLTVPARK